jgi:hypothetical protein
MAGVIGRKKICFDIWGTPLEECNSMIPHGIVGKVLISDSCHVLLTEKYDCALYEEIPHKDGTLTAWVPKHRRSTRDHSHPFLVQQAPTL